MYSSSIEVHHTEKTIRKHVSSNVRWSGLVPSDPYDDEIVPADWEALFGDDNDEAPQTMKIDVLIDVNI